MVERSREQKLKVFVSYSRHDSTFAGELVSALDACGFEAFLDQHDIAPGEPWEERLGRLIQGADTVVFVISPDSVTSQRCGWEIEQTDRLGKRLLPIVIRPVPESDVPGRLKRLNYVFFGDGHPFGIALKALAEALTTDIDWVREHTRLSELALRWEGRGRHEALLMRGNEIEDAKQWVSRRPRDAPEPTLLMREFIAHSEQVETERSGKEKEQAARARRLRWTIAASLAALLMMTGISTFAFWQRGEALTLRAEAERLRTEAEKAAADAGQARSRAELDRDRASDSAKEANQLHELANGVIGVLLTPTASGAASRVPGAAASDAKPGWHGIEVANVDRQVAQEFSLVLPVGVRVVNVESNSPAALAGLNVLDVIFAANSRGTANRIAFDSAMGTLPAGAPVTLNVVRGRQLHALSLTLLERPAQLPGADAQAPPVVLSVRSAGPDVNGNAVIIVAVRSNPRLGDFQITVGDNGRAVTVAPRRVPLPPGAAPAPVDAELVPLEIPLYSGVNVVRVVARNALGQSEASSIAINNPGTGALGSPRALRVLSIGIDRYPGATPYPGNLMFAGKDARDFADTVRRTIGRRLDVVDIDLLYNGAGGSREPTKANIEAALQRLSRSGPKDTVVLFIAGHGEKRRGQYVVLPTDHRRTRADEPGEVVVDWRMIRESLANATGRGLVFLDTTRSGGGYNDALAGDARTFRFTAFNTLRVGSIRASEDPNLGQGIFTYAVRLGLEGDAMRGAPIDVYDLGSYISRKVRELSNGGQEAEFFAGAGNFALVQE